MFVFGISIGFWTLALAFFYTESDIIVSFYLGALFASLFGLILRSGLVYFLYY